MTKSYLNTCPVFDNDPDGGFGDYFYKTLSTIDFTDETTEFYKKTIEQVTSTNMLEIFEGQILLMKQRVFLKITTIDT